MDKDLKNLFKELREQGWELRETRKGYYAVPPDPTKALVQIHLTALGVADHGRTCWPS